MAATVWTTSGYAQGIGHKSLSESLKKWQSIS